MPRSPPGDRYQHARPGGRPPPLQPILHEHRSVPVISPPLSASPYSEHPTMSAVSETLASGSPPPLVTSSSATTSQFSNLAATPLPTESAQQSSPFMPPFSPHTDFSNAGVGPVEFMRAKPPPSEVSGTLSLRHRESPVPDVSQADDPMELDYNRRLPFEASAANYDTARSASAIRSPLIRVRFASQISDRNERITAPASSMPEWSSYPEGRQDIHGLASPERGLGVFPIPRNFSPAGPSRLTRSHPPSSIRPHLAIEPPHLAALNRDLVRSGVHELGILEPTYRPSAFRPRSEFADRTQEPRSGSTATIFLPHSVPDRLRSSPRAVRAEPIRIPAAPPRPTAFGTLQPGYLPYVSSRRESDNNGVDMPSDPDPTMPFANGTQGMIAPRPFMGTHHSPSARRSPNSGGVSGEGERASPHTPVNELFPSITSDTRSSVPLPRPASIDHPVFNYPNPRLGGLDLPSHRHRSLIPGPINYRSNAGRRGPTLLDHSASDGTARRSPYLRQRLADLDTLRTQAEALPSPVDWPGDITGMLARLEDNINFTPSHPSRLAIPDHSRETTRSTEETRTFGRVERQRPLARRWLSHDEGQLEISGVDENQQGSSGSSQDSIEYSEIDFWNRTVQDAVTRRLPPDAPRLEALSPASQHRYVIPYMFARPHPPDIGRHRNESIADTTAYPQPALPGRLDAERLRPELWGHIPVETVNPVSQESSTQLQQSRASHFAQRLQRYRQEPERRAEYQTLSEEVASSSTGPVVHPRLRARRQSPVESAFDDDWRNGHHHTHTPSYGSIVDALGMGTRGGANPLIELFSYFQLKPDMPEADRCRILQTVVRAVSRWPSDSRRKAADMAIEKLPWGDFGQRIGMDRDVRCSVCHDEYEDAVKISITPCKHMYHKECLDTWLDLPNTSSCPMCRRDLAVLVCLVKMVPGKSQEEALPVWLSIPA